MIKLHPDEQKWLDQYREALAQKHPGMVLRMLVYGSKARGDAREDSDLDILVVVRDDAINLKRPLRDIGYDLAATSWAVPSIMAYTEQEWDRLKALQSPYRDAVERHGVSVL